jgi:L-threonylcarbamoyladenylate synthase
MATQVYASDDPVGLQKALDLLQQSHLVAFPTDTIYGLGGLAFDAQAIDRLYLAKGRDLSKAVPVLIGKPADLCQVTSSMGEVAQRLAARFWPGPLTLVVRRHPALPENLSGFETVGVRMPDHPVALKLLRLAGPMAVSSANLSNQPSANTAEEVLAQLGGRIPLIIDGGHTPGGLASTVVDCSGGDLRILRPGPITLAQLTAALAA